MAKKKKVPSNTIVLNKKSKFDYFIESNYEAGIVLEGWEVKSLRSGKIQIKESYIRLIRGELFLMGCHISALETVSTHVVAEPLRVRKLLLHDYEILKLTILVERKGYTLVPVSLYWKNGKVKVNLGVAKGKKQHDKRAALKEKDFQRTEMRNIKSNM